MRRANARGWVSRLVACLTLLLAVGGPISCSSDPEKTEEAPVAQQTQAVIQSFTMSFTLPNGMDVATMAVGASTSLNSRDRTRIEGPMGVRQGPLVVDNDARTKALTAGGAITIRDRSIVTGNVRASGSVTRSPSSTVTGTIQANTNLGPTKTIQWTFQADNVSAGDVILAADEQRDLLPGSYGTLNVATRAKVTLHTGVYRFGRIIVEPQGKLMIDSVNGPVQAYFTVGLTFRGAIETARFGAPQLLLGHQGTETVVIEAPFTGVLVAPNADVRFQAATPKGHDAVIYGKNVTLEPDTVVRVFPFSWGSVDPKLQPPFDPNRPKNPMPTSPADNPVGVDNTGSGRTTTTSDSPTPVGFRLPASYPVSGGEMCNSTVTFRFRQGTGPLVTCTYRGGSSTSTPSTEEELNKGRTLHFQSCSDGQPVTTQRQANHFELAMTPCPGFPAVVTAPVINDNFCSESLELLTVDQTRQMRLSFDWDAHKTDHLDEVTPDGMPALYYAWVFVRDKEDALALRQLFIHQLTKPLFRDELMQFAGKCGRITNPGDGVGQFVPVVIPGKTYNRLVAALTDPNVQGNREIFDAVIIRQVPPEARNPNNSINLQKLVNSGFDYLYYEQRHPLPNYATLELDTDPSALLVNAIDFVAEAAVDAAEVVTQGFALLSRLFLGTVNVRVDVLADNQDPNFLPSGFTGPAPFMIRGWGPLAGRPLGAPGLQVTILQPTLSVLPIPATSMGNTDPVGRVNISAIDDPISPAAICVELKNDGALVTDLILASEVCDFRAFLPGNSSHPLRDMDNDKEFINHSNDGAWIGMFEATDVFEWDKQVAHIDPKRARITTGYWGDTIGDHDDNGRQIPWTACLNFGNVVTPALIAAGQGVGGIFAGALPTGPQPAIGTALAAMSVVLANTDTFVGSHSTVRTNRGVMSHEYGHYTFCHLLANENPLADDYLILSTIAHFGDTSQPFAFISEAFAEFMEGQVSGAAEYGWLSNPVSDVGGDSQFCNGGRINPGTRVPGCWDANARAGSGIARVATLFMDAFDGHPNGRGTNVPGNGDVWMTPPPPPPTPPADQLLVFSPANYLDVDASIERVHMPGQALFAFAEEYADLLPPLPQVDLGTALGLLSLMNEPRVFRSVNHAMMVHGNNWCERCRVLALHDTDLPDKVCNPLPPAGAACLETPVELINHCLNDPSTRTALQEPPPNNGNFNFADCSPCPGGQVANGMGGCGDCPADMTLDGATMSISGPLAIDPTSQQAPNDICPGTFLVVINNPQAAFARGANRIAGLTGPVNPPTQASCQRSFQLNVASLTPSGIVPEPSITSTGQFVCNPPPTPCIALCNNLPTRTFLPGSIPSGTSIRFGAPADPSMRLTITAGQSGGI